jgi:3-hydroxyacyl-CoA dehydrogenase
MSKRCIGFIGLGIMGRPMAGHLLEAGHELVVHDLDRAAVAELVAAHHDRQRRLPRTHVAAADRGIQAPHTLARQGLAHLHGHTGSNRAHVHMDVAGLDSRHQATLAQGHSLDIGGVGEHGDDQGGLAGHLTGR